VSQNFEGQVVVIWDEFVYLVIGVGYYDQIKAIVIYGMQYFYNS